MKITTKDIEQTSMSPEIQTLGGWIKQAIRSDALEDLMNGSAHGFESLARLHNLDTHELAPADEDSGPVLGLAADENTWFVAVWPPRNIQRSLGDATIHGPYAADAAVDKLNE